MPILIRGDRLHPTTRGQVLEAFGYRWTVENEKRAREWHGLLNLDSRTLWPDDPTETDAEWLAGSAFYVNEDGCLPGAIPYAHCEPASVAPDPVCACCGWTLRQQDSARQVEGTNMFRCDLCSSGRGACCHRAGRGVGTLSSL